MELVEIDADPYCAESALMLGRGIFSASWLLFKVVHVTCEHVTCEHVTSRTDGAALQGGARDLRARDLRARDLTDGRCCTRR